MSRALPRVRIERGTALKGWHRIMLATVLGLAVGVSLAVYRVRGGLAAGQITNGPWATAKTYGSAQADALTRARVALSGLLALPATEAMYFTAKTDSAGRPLDGRCVYKLSLPEIPARWWSITAYQGEGWLIANPGANYSVGSGFFGDEAGFIVVGPKPPMPWSGAPKRGYISTGGVAAFDLTLRAYHPSADLLAHPDAAKLPSIERGPCK